MAKRDAEILIVGTYVDDIILLSKNRKWIKEITQKLGLEFKVKNLGEIQQCLGIEFTRSNDEIRLSQTRYAEDILRRFGMESCKAFSSPLDANMKLKKPESRNAEDDKLPYRELIGSLMYLAVGTRPDITFAVNSLSQYNSCYTREHWIAAKRILRYIKGTLECGIVFRKTGIELQGFVDADWGACINDRRSYIGYVFTFAGAAISWESKKQRTVALSSTQTEYMTLTDGAKEAIHLRRFLREIGVNLRKPTPIWNDNQ